MQAMGFNDLNSATSSTSSDPNYRKRYMQPPRGRRPAAASYNEAFLGKSKHPAPIWRWPAFWALLSGFLIQMLAGVLASLFSLFLLLGANPKRCPVAVGADSVKPLLAWMVGVGIALKCCAIVMRESTNPSLNWAIWGAPACIFEAYRIEKNL